MNKLHVLRVILKRSKVQGILSGFVLYILATALLIQIVEPDIHTYQDSLWYCYAVISTAGFGDVVVVTLLGKIFSVLLTVYSILAVAIITGVVVNYFTEMNKLQQKETIALFMDKLENLPNLSKDELYNISEKVKKLR